MLLGAMLLGAVLLGAMLLGAVRGAVQGLWPMRGYKKTRSMQPTLEAYALASTTLAWATMRSSARTQSALCSGR